MAEVRPLPMFGDVFVDVRGGDRTMRVSLHPDAGVVVVSIWVGRHCTASCRLSTGEAQRLLGVLDGFTPPSATASPGGEAVAEQALTG